MIEISHNTKVEEIEKQKEFQHLLHITPWYCREGDASIAAMI